MKKISAQKAWELAGASLFFLIIIAAGTSCVSRQDGNVSAYDSDCENANIQSCEREIPLGQADFSSYENELSREDWEALSGFFPVLIEGKPVLAVHCPNRDEEPEAALEEQRIQDFFVDENTTGDFILDSFTLCDVTDDGKKELVLYTNCYGGWYWVLHREGGTFYGVYMPVRWFQELQRNGIHTASGGAGHIYYDRIHFEDGFFWKEPLGRTDWNKEENAPCYFIDGKEVSESEFEAWSEEVAAGEAPWYTPRL